MWSNARTIPWVMARNKNEALIDDAACGAPGWCSIVGSYENGLQGVLADGTSPQYVDFEQSEEHGVWSKPIALTATSWNESGDGAALVACPDRASCTIAGLQGQVGSIAFVQHLVLGVPKGRVTYELYGSGGPSQVSLGGLSCPSAGGCGLLLGSYDDSAAIDARGRLVAVNELRGVWGKPKALRGYPGASGLGGPGDATVSCSTPLHCVAATDVSGPISDPGYPTYYLTS